MAAEVVSGAPEGGRAPVWTLELAQRYLAAWNAHDGTVVADLVTGTYGDPALPEPVHGPVLAAYVDGLCAALPDLHLVDERPPVVDGDRVVVSWRMRGTNDGAPLPGAPAPTGGSCDLPGVDVLTFAHGRLVDVRGYFDRTSLLEQLGLVTFVLPQDGWPISYGTSVRADLGHLDVPGALSMTWIEVADDAEQAELLQRSTEVVTALAGDPAFLGWQATIVGRRNTTLTLWTTPAAAEAALARNVPHARAAARRLQEGFGGHGFTSLWQPYRLNSQLVTCACGRVVAFADGATRASCECGVSVQARPYV